jgi:hypothetical protein
MLEEVTPIVADVGASPVRSLAFLPGIRFRAEEGAAVAEPPPAEFTPDPPATAEPAVAEPAQPEPQLWERPEFHAAVAQASQGALQEFLQSLPDPDARPAEPAPLPEFDPFRPETHEPYVRARAEQVARELIAPMQERLSVLDRVEHREHQQIAREHLEGLKATVGQFDTDKASLMGFAYMRQGLAPAEALERAAREDVAYRAAIRAEADAELAEKYRTLATTTTEPAGGAGAAEPTPTVPTGPRRYEQSVKESLDRMRANGNAA